MATSTGFNNGRRFQDPSGAYVLPNDTIEHERLDTQSQAYVQIMHGKPFHAPLKNPKRILDIGCGTGSMTAMLAEKYPEAEVIGVDISPVPQERHQKLKNLSYVQGDIMDLAGGDDERFALGSADYIFHRLLVLGIKDWQKYVQTVQSLLRPGGWAELQDIDVSVFDGEGKCTSDEWWSHITVMGDCAVEGYDPAVGVRLTTLLKEAGSFDSINEVMYKLPMRGDPARPDSKLMGEVMEKNMETRVALVRRMCGNKRPQEEVERIIDGTRESYGNLTAEHHTRLFVATAQKTG